jgi:lysine-N-methylase
VTGGRLQEFLDLVVTGLDSEVPADPAAVPAPTWVGRMLFRQTLAIYCRQDHGPDRGVAVQGTAARAAAVWRFTRGRGEVPRLHARLPQTTFEQLDQPAGPLPEDAERVLERYYAVKVESLQFCGPSNFGLSFWDGLDSLVLTMPVILWLARAFRDRSHEAAAVQAVGIADNQFGFNPLLGSGRQRTGLRILARRGELEKLVAFYSR